MVKRKGVKKGYHTHFCLRIIPQGKRKEAERKELLNKIQEYRKFHTQESGNDYHLFDKLLRISERTAGDYCNLCRPLYDILEDRDPRVDTILFLGHHWLYPEEDQTELVTLAKMLRNDKKVNKFQILYLDSLSEMKTTHISAMQENDVRDIIRNKKTKISEFVNIVEKGEHSLRTIYGISNR